MAGLDDFVTFQLLGSGAPAPVAADDFTTALAEKYASRQSPIGAFSPGVRAALENMDRDRVARGGQMLGTAESIRLATAAQTRELQTPAPKRSVKNLPGNALRDIRNIVTGIPQMPLAVLREFQDASNIGAYMERAREQGMNPVETVANAPGVRMLPGAYIVGNVAGGNFRELAEHPVFTALDVLPAATKVAKGTTAARVAQETADAAAAAGKFVKPVRPLKAATMFSVATDPTTGALSLQRNMLGRTTEALSNTVVGAKMRETGGAAARASMRTTSTWNAALMQTLVSDAPIPQRLSAAREYVTAMREADQTWARWEKSQGPGWVADTTARMKLGDTADFTPEQHLYKQEYVTVLDRMRALEAAESIGPMQLANGEWYDRVTAGSIVRSEVKARRLEGNKTLRDAIVQAESAPDPQLALDALARAREVAARPLSTARGRGANDRAFAAYRGEVGKGRRMQEIRGWLHAAEAAGVDVSAVRAAMKPGAAPDDLLKALDKTIASPAPFAGSPAMAASRRAKYVESLRVKDNTVANARAAADRKVAGEVPSRFVHKVRESMEARVVDELEARAGRNLDPAELENGLRLYYEKRYVDAGLDDQWVSTTAREVAATWQRMRDEGLDPVWVHDIPPSRVHAGMYPRVTELPNTPSQSKKQFLDPRPTTNDAFLALNQQGMEWVKRYASEQHIVMQRNLFGKTRDQVYDMYRDRAMRLAKVSDPRFEQAYIKELERLVSREWKPFNPIEQGYTWDSQALRNMAQEDIFLPREVAENLRRLHDADFGAGLRFMDPMMKVFRTSVLPLSPNWHAGNVIGNAISTAVTNPRALLKLREAYELFSKGRNGLGLDEELLLRMGHEADALKEMSFHEGSPLARIAQEAESHRVRAVAGAVSSNPGYQKVSSVFGRAVNKSFDWNQRVDQFFRAANYLAEEQRLVKLGKNADAARAGAIDLATKVLPDFASLTPIERQIFRYIFPFYSWTQHILRLTANLPIDHPSRVAIMASLTRAELEDLPSGLSEEFLGMLPVGGRMLKLGSWNPFGRVADSMTLLGFLAGMNPVFNMALEQAGVKGGQRDAYPTLRYDPQTGRMQAVGPGIVSSLAYGMIPQLEPIANLTGLDNTYTELSVTDPGAAQRRMAGAFGLPTPIAPRTIEESVIANERASFQAMSEAANEALRTGDFSRAKQFPGLASWIATVQLMAERGDFQRGAKVPPIPGSADAYKETQKAAAVSPAPVTPVPVTPVVGSMSGAMRMGGL